MQNLPADLKGLLVAARNNFHQQHSAQQAQLDVGQTMAFELDEVRTVALQMCVRLSLQPDPASLPALAALRERILNEFATV